MHLSEKARAAMQKVVAKMEAGDLSPVVHVAAYERKGEPVPWDNWSLGNRMMTFVESGGSTDLRGFKQWKKVGRWPKPASKRQHDAWILVPLRHKVTNKETGEEEYRLYNFGSSPVFAYDDTEGEPLEEHSYGPKEPPPLLDVAERLGVEVTWDYAVVARGALGSVTPEGDKITLGSDDLEPWFHELAHAALAKTNGRLKPGQHEDQEAAAELAAAVIMEMYGVDRTGNAWRYISTYAKDPLSAIAKALADVEVVLSVVFGSDGF